jgi:hypothetical protein
MSHKKSLATLSSDHKDLLSQLDLLKSQALDLSQEKKGLETRLTESLSSLDMQRVALETLSDENNDLLSLSDLLKAQDSDHSNTKVFPTPTLL